MSTFDINVRCAYDAWEEVFEHYDRTLSFAARYISEELQIDGRGFEINILLSEDKVLQVLNRDYRSKDKPTNVLSFPFHSIHCDSQGMPVLPERKVQGMTETLGDIAVSFQKTYHEAQIQNKPFEHHFIHLCVHGILHILGYDHEQDIDAINMELLEIKILKKFGIENPYELAKTPLQIL